MLFLLSANFFSKSPFSKKISFRNLIKVSKSADDTSKQRVKVCVVFVKVNCILDFEYIC